MACNPLREVQRHPAGPRPGHGCIGMGQVNRVDSCHLAVERANTLADGADRATGAVAASDCVLPVRRWCQVLIDAGVKAIVQPGGSIRDEEVIEAAKKAGVTMYLTGTRHFFTDRDSLRGAAQPKRTKGGIPPDPSTGPSGIPPCYSPAIVVT